MKYLCLGLAVLLSACSTSPVKDPTPKEESSGVTKSSFKKDRPLTQNEVKDFYSPTIKSVSPALMDESLDRFTIEEASKLPITEDPLMKITMLCMSKKYDEALAFASKNYNAYQKIAAYWNQIANCHLNQGNSRKALLFYNKALEVNANYIPALNNIGVLYMRQGDEQKALIAFDRAYNKSRFSKTPRYNLGKLYLSYGLAELALPLLQGLLNDSPNDLQLLNAVASAHFILGDYSTAANMYKKISPAAYRYAEVGLNYAATLKKLNRDQEAKDVYAGIQVPNGQALKAYHASIGQQLGVQ